MLVIAPETCGQNADFPYTLRGRIPYPPAQRVDYRNTKQNAPQCKSTAERFRLELVAGLEPATC